MNDRSVVLVGCGSKVSHGDLLMIVGKAVSLLTSMTFCVIARSTGDGEYSRTGSCMMMGDICGIERLWVPAYIHGNKYNS